MVKYKKQRQNKLLACGILLSLQLNSVVLAATMVVPDGSYGKNPSVMQAANGTTVVNIRIPNNKGLSHNQYNNLQVGNEGVVFNNSADIVKTQLAGYITGNKYLVGSIPAKVILNEVTGKLPTTLNGYMEIAGNKADLVLANPNGIIGNNFGYINTNRAVLTTGTPILAADGGLHGFNVSKGHIELNGLGMDATTTTKTELFARAARINAGIWSQDLKVVTGSNTIDYATGNIRAVINNEDKGVSLDVGALGGMYARKISLIGTAKGLGVNLEGVVSVYDQDLTMNQEGKLLIKNKMEAKGNVNLISKASMENDGDIYSGNNITTQVPGSITNRGLIEAKNVNKLISKANVQNSGTIYGKQEATIKSTGDITNSGTIYGKQKATIKSTGDITNNGTIYGKQLSSLNTQGNINNAGILTSENVINLAANQNLQNTGEISGSEIKVMAVDVQNSNKATIQGRSTTTIKTRGGLVNNGTIYGKQEAAIKATSGITNVGLIAGENIIDLQANTRTENKGTIQGGNTKISNFQGDIINSGTIKGKHKTTIKAVGNITNSGNIYDEKMATVNATGDITNSGNIYDKKIATVNATGNLINSGLIVGENSTKLKAGKSLNNTGTINGGDTTILIIADVNNINSGKIYGDNLNIQGVNVNNIIGNSAPVIAARKDMHLETVTLNNKKHSVLTAEGNMSITADIINNNSATLEAGNNMELKATTIHNTNENFSAAIETVKEEDVVEYQPKDNTVRYKAGDTNYKIDTSGYIHDKDKYGVAAGYDIFVVDGDEEHDEDEDIALYVQGQRYCKWYRYEYRRTTKESVVKNTDPAQITAGGNLHITGNDLINDKSKIMAGGTITANVAHLNNVDVPGKRYVEDKGTTHYYHIEDHGHGHGHYMETKHDTTSYAAPIVVTDIMVRASDYTANKKPTSSGTVAGLGTYNTMFRTVKEQSNKDLDTYHNRMKSSQNVLDPSTRKVDIQKKAVGTTYYVETDPNYTNGNNFLSSDYFFAQMGYDVDNVAKRLGDGYYEQKLVSDQVMNLTGKRFTESATSNEEQYKLLLDNAAQFAQDNALTIGVALTAEQQAKLTEAMVWMVEQSVGLPDGRIVKALVPVVYVPQEETPYGTRGAAVIAAQDIDIKAVNDILNQGTIRAADSTKLAANNINNLGGTIQGSKVIVDALNDVNNVGGTLAAEKAMNVTAGHNVNMETTTTHAENSKGSRDALNQVTGAYVTDNNGKLNIEAGNDINLKAADIAATGENSKLNVKAGRDVNLDAVQAGSSNDIVFNKKNYRHDRVSADVGTSMQSGGNAKITAGRDVNATAAYVRAEKDLRVKAGNKINAEKGGASAYVEERHEYTNRGFFGSTTTVDHTISDKKGAAGSTFSGDTVKLEAGKDVNVTGSNVVGTNDVNVKAGRDVNITAATETEDVLDFHKETTSGIMGSGMGIMLGTQTTKETTTNQNTTKAGSRVGSVAGNVNITAGNKAKVEAADIRADKDINITGSEVDITSSDETYNNKYKYEHDMTGLTISVGGGIVGRVQRVVGSLERAKQVTDGRLSALYGVKAAQDAGKLVQPKEYGVIGASGDPKVQKEIEAGNAKAKADNAKNKAFDINIGFGSSHSEQTSNIASTIAKESNVNAGGKVNINATGKDVNIHGSHVSGENVTISAKENVNITAAENTNVNKTDSSSSSVGVGVSISTAGGVGGYLNASMSKENENTDGTSYTPSTVTVKDKLTINSGKDTNVIGSQVRGDRVETNAKGDLNVESKQDTNMYKESSSSASIGLSSSGVSGSASKGKMNSDYASVTNQAGIYAGDKGFDVNVKGNTDLKGAVIDSTAPPDKNKLTTGTLSFSDIKNKAEYSTSGIGASLDSAATKDKHALLGDKGLIPNIPMSSSDDASSTTKSGIAPGTITITNEDKQKQDISKLNRNTNNTLNKLDQIFDKKTVQEKQELAGLFGELAYNKVHEIANKKGWKDGSAEKNALHAVVGGIMSKLTGSGFISGASGAMVNEMVQNELSKIDDPALHQWASVAIGAAVSGTITGNAQAGASSAASGTKNNYLDIRKPIMRMEIIRWKGNLNPLTFDSPHAGMRIIYSDGMHIEVHAGNYTKQNSPKGPGVILQANSTKFIDDSLASGKAEIYDVITDVEQTRQIAKNINALMEMQANKYWFDDVEKGGIVPKVVDRYETGKIDSVYIGGNKKFGEYILGITDCFEFLKDAAGKYSKIGTSNRKSFFIYNR